MKKIIIPIIVILLISFVSAEYAIVFEDETNIPRIISEEREVTDYPAFIDSLAYSSWQPIEMSDTKEVRGVYYYKLDEEATSKAVYGMLFEEEQPTRYYFKIEEEQDLTSALNLEEDLIISYSELVKEDSLKILTIKSSTEYSKIGGNKFTALDYGSQFTLDSKGYIKSAEVIVGEGQGTYIISGFRYIFPEFTEITMAGNAITNVDYSNVEGTPTVEFFTGGNTESIKVDGADGFSEINGVAHISGDDVLITDTDGEILLMDSGSIRYISNEDFYMEEGGAQVTKYTNDGTVQITTVDKGVWVTECNSVNSKRDDAVDLCGEKIYASGENLKITQETDKLLEYRIQDGSIRFDDSTDKTTLSGDVIQYNCGEKTHFKQGNAYYYPFDTEYSQYGEGACREIASYYNGYKVDTFETVQRKNLDCFSDFECENDGYETGTFSCESGECYQTTDATEFDTQVSKLQSKVAPKVEGPVEGEELTEESLWVPYPCSTEEECEDIVGEENNYDCVDGECYGISEEVLDDDEFKNYQEEIEDLPDECTDDYDCIASDYCWLGQCYPEEVEESTEEEPLEEYQCYASWDCYSYPDLSTEFDYECADGNCLAVEEDILEEPVEEEEQQLEEGLEEELEEYEPEEEIECLDDPECIYLYENSPYCLNNFCVQCKEQIHCPNYGEKCVSNVCVGDEEVTVVEEEPVEDEVIEDDDGTTEEEEEEPQLSCNNDGFCDGLEWMHSCGDCACSSNAECYGIKESSAACCNTDECSKSLRYNKQCVPEYYLDQISREGYEDSTIKELDDADALSQKIAIDCDWDGDCYQYGFDICNEDFLCEAADYQPIIAPIEEEDLEEVIEAAEEVNEGNERVTIDGTTYANRDVAYEEKNQEVVQEMCYDDLYKIYRGSWEEHKDLCSTEVIEAKKSKSSLELREDCYTALQEIYGTNWESHIVDCNTGTSDTLDRCNSNMEVCYYIYPDYTPSYQPVPITTDELAELTGTDPAVLESKQEIISDVMFTTSTTAASESQAESTQRGYGVSTIIQDDGLLGEYALGGHETDRFYGQMVEETISPQLDAYVYTEISSEELQDERFNQELEVFAKEFASNQKAMEEIDYVLEHQYDLYGEIIVSEDQNTRNKDEVTVNNIVSSLEETNEVLSSQQNLIEEFYLSHMEEYGFDSEEEAKAKANEYFFEQQQEILAFSDPYAKERKEGWKDFFDPTPETQKLIGDYSHQVAEWSP
jgi:hypothetical protein